MAQLTVEGVDIRGVSTCVPAQAIGPEAYASDPEAKRAVESAGTLTRHVAAEEVCTSDLCERAARELLARLDWAPESVELLVLVTHSNDYIMPATACLLQHRLGLSDRCAAFDVGLGCSGYVYGIALASSMMGQGRIPRALVLVGDTPSKLFDPTDRATALIFGDGASATALEASGSATKSWFLLHTDGAGQDDFIVKAGGFRDRFNADRREHYMRMNGAGIFAFTLNRVPRLVADSLAYAGLTDDQVDYYIFHQANRFMLDHLRNKIQLAPEKVPVNIHLFSNTAGTSVALCMTRGGLDRPADRPAQLLLLGFGVGLSWGSAAVRLAPDAPLIHSEL